MQSEKRRTRDKQRYRIARTMFRSLKHVREWDVQQNLQVQIPHLVSLDRTFRPDFWDPLRCCFVEVKLVSKINLRGFYDLRSKHFSNYYFKRVALQGRDYMSIDEYLSLYPKPLLLKLYDFQTGQFLHEKLFPREYEKQMENIEKIERIGGRP